ncbi:cell division protein ZapD [Klebsiella pneumoniae]|nr:cell division protein ZapD [Klebsiella pneumoniae]
MPALDPAGPVPEPGSSRSYPQLRAVPQKQTSLNGFYQDNGEDADSAAPAFDLAHQLYPQISGHKSRFAIRFLGC